VVITVENLVNLAHLAIDQLQDYREAERLADEVLALIDNVDPSRVEPRFLPLMLGDLYHLRGLVCLHTYRYAESRNYLERSLPLLAEAKYELKYARALLDLGCLEVAVGNTQAAITRLTEAVDVNRKIHDASDVPGRAKIGMNGQENPAPNWK
jgi:tetratricopeptide (TPR) repeat protein